MTAIRNRIVASGEADPAALKANPSNWRIHGEYQKAALTGLLDQVGWVQEVIVNKASGLIVDGHLRVAIAAERGEATIPVKYIDLNPEEERLVLGTYDPLGDLATGNDKALKAILAGIKTSDPVIDGLLDQLGKRIDIERLLGDAGKEVPDDVQALLKTYPVVRGQQFQIGRHVLRCGSSADEGDVAALFGTAKADCLCTDPPYGVEYSAKQEHLAKQGSGTSKSVRKAIQNDAGLNYREFFGAFLRLAPMAKKNTAYITMSGQELHNLRLALDDAGFTWGDYLIWLKDQLVLNRKDYNAKHEFIVYGWKGTHKFYGPTNATTILEFDRPRRAEYHPTMKPIELMQRLIEDGTPKGGVVYDAFLGSGTTMLAAHASGRTCFGMELEPLYCAVTLHRMTELGCEVKRIA